MATEKQKYLINLNREDVIVLKKLLEELGLPRTQFAVLLNEHIATLIPMFREMIISRRENRDLTLGDLITITSKAAADVYEDKP